jgi:endonuclease-8
VPEGDTIFQTAAGLRPLLVGQQILRARSGRTPGPQMQRVVGARVTAIDTMGKHMLIHFDNGLALHTHLRMGGTWHRYAPGEPWRIADWKARVVLEVEGHVVVCFNAPVAELMPSRATHLHPALATLGPDLLSPEFSADDAFARMRAHPDLEIAEALLDQRLMAGVGNVIKTETLFLESLNPWTHVSMLDDEHLKSAIATARRLLQDNATPGHPQRVTTRSDPQLQTSLYIYGRAGRPCPRCRTPIQLRRQGALNRVTYWCPSCQPAATSQPARESPRTAYR